MRDGGAARRGDCVDAHTDIRTRPDKGRGQGAGTETDPYADADGVVIVCGAAETDGDGSGEPYYLSFVRFDDGREVEPAVPLEEVSFDFRR